MIISDVRLAIDLSFEEENERFTLLKIGKGKAGGCMRFTCEVVGLYNCLIPI